MSHPSRFSVREFLAIVMVGAGALVASCRDSTSRTQHIDDLTLTARPGTPTATATPGLTPLGLDPSVDGLLYVPANYQATMSTPVLVLLHASGGTPAEWFTEARKALFDEIGIVVVAPESREFDWDLTRTGLYGPDVEFIDAALAHAFARINVDGTKIGIGGFSSGASESLGIGIANGDVISHVMAFSPARLFGPFRRGIPSFFVAHGADDPVVSIALVRDVMIPLLQGVFRT